MIELFDRIAEVRAQLRGRDLRSPVAAADLELLREWAALLEQLQALLFPGPGP